MEQEPVDLFYSYAHEDEPLRDELERHLKIMERRGVIRSWHDRSIVPGQQWNQEIDAQLAAADLILLLVSADFISSDYIWGHELATAMQRHQRGEADVVPVMLRAADIDDAPFAKLQGLPTDLRPVTSWPNRDEAWTDVAKGIRRTVREIQARRPGESAPARETLRLAGSPEITRNARFATMVTRPDGRFDRNVSAAPEAAPDPLLDRVLDEFSAQVAEAAKARGTAAPDSAADRRFALALIDAPDQKRVLWVDDQPANNRFETVALAKLQIEVAAVTSTEAALARIAGDSEPFDLVLSDWSRSEPRADAPSAGVRLLRELRARGNTIPVVFYHRSQDADERRRRHALAQRDGAFGEAVTPDELLALVAAALSAA